MFFKISLIVIAVFVVVYMNIPEDSTSLTSTSSKKEMKKEAVQVFLQQEELPPTKDECKSYIRTVTGTICVLSNVSTSSGKEAEVDVVIVAKATIEDAPIPQNLPDGLENRVSVSGHIVGIDAITKEESRSVPIDPF